MAHGNRELRAWLRRDQGARACGAVTPGARVARRQVAAADIPGALRLYGEAIREMQANGAGLGRIANQLNADRVPTRKGGRWKKGTLHGILNGKGVIRQRLITGRPDPQ